MKQSITMFTCDRCHTRCEGRSGGGYEDDKRPLSWSEVRIENDKDAPIRELCKDCTALLNKFLQGAEVR